MAQGVIEPLAVALDSRRDEPQDVYRVAGATSNLAQLAPVIETANKLQYRVCCMTHAFEPLRRGRGKRYEFEQLDDEAREAIRHRFTRDLSVCARLASHPQFPACYTTFPDKERDTWWVIDEWIDGDALAEQLRRGPSEPEPLSRVGRQLAARPERSDFVA